MLHAAELVVSNMEHGVPNAEGRDHQGRAAADAHQHHGHAQLVAEHVAQGDLLQKGQGLPQERDILQQNALAAFAPLGPDQLRRDTAQASLAGCQGCTEDSNQGHSQRDHGKALAIGIFQGCELVQDPIGPPENLRQRPGAQEEAQKPAQEGGTEGIEQVLCRNVPAVKAHGFQYADLGPLLADHSRHGSNAHQQGDHNKEHRQKIGHGGYNGRIILEADKPGILPAGKDIGIRLLQIHIFRVLPVQAQQVQIGIILVPGKGIDPLGDFRLVGFNKPVVFRGIDIRRPPQARIHLGIHIHGKSVRVQQKKPL